MVGQKFSGPSIDHWCLPPEGSVFEKWSPDAWRKFSSPFMANGKRDPCHIYDLEYNSSSISEFLSGSQDKKNSSLVECKKWGYDTSTFTNSIVEQWDLVCDKAFYPNLAQSIFFSGVFVGVFIAGVLSDRFGRKNTMFGLLCLFIGNKKLVSMQGLVVDFIFIPASGIGTAFAPTFETWVMFRWFMAFGSLGMKTVKCVLGLELIGGRWRTYVMIGFYQVQEMCQFFSIRFYYLLI